MNIGYACLTVGISGIKQRTCTMKNATPDVLFNLIETNLKALDKALDYNIQNGIKLFRISSDIIPFGSHPVNTVKWWEIFSDKLNEIGHKAITNGVRLSMHPGQYTVLNSPDEAVFYKQPPTQDVDIMVEVKYKNLSALKCINTIASPKIQRLEKEWGRYKYLVLEHAPKGCQDIRQLLKDKNRYPVVEFYRLIDEALMTPVKPGNAVNAAQYVWGYFKDSSDKNTRLRFERIIDKVSKGESTIPMKRLLWKLAEDKQQQYLLDSLYFMKLL